MQIVKYRKMGAIKTKERNDIYGKMNDGVLSNKLEPLFELSKVKINA